MKNSILNEVRQIVADIFNLPLECITAQSSPDTIEGWDSLQQVNLVVALEPAPEALVLLLLLAGGRVRSRALVRLGVLVVLPVELRPVGAVPLFTLLIGGVHLDPHALNSACNSGHGIELKK